MLHGHCARVEEDQDDDEPEPPLLLAHASNGDPGPSNAGGKLALGTFRKKGVE